VKDMIGHIRRLKGLPPQFRAAEIIKALNEQDNENHEPVDYAGTFLWKHSDKNHRPNSGRKYFKWEGEGLYSLRKFLHSN
jgi:hypothetical protein